MRVYFDYFHVINSIFHKNIGAGIKNPFAQSGKHSTVKFHQIYCNSAVENSNGILNQDPTYYCPPGCSVADAVLSSFPV